MTPWALVVLPDLIERNRPTRQLRIWSAGCSIGAEAYSVAILLRRDLGNLLGGWDVTVIGTDINRRFLARAREGRFEDWSLRGMSEEVKRSCFARAGKSWLIAPEYRVNVAFQYHNLVTHILPSHLNNLFAFDLILCRNVTIYFNPEIVRRIIDHFHLCLVEGGWLIVGHAEPNLEWFRSFRTVNAPGAILYQKRCRPGASRSVSDRSLASRKRTPPESGRSWEPQQLEEARPHLFTADSGRGPGETANHRLRRSANAPGSATAVSSADSTRTWRPSALLADRGDWEKATQCCRAAADRRWAEPTGVFFHGLIDEQRGKHGEAEDALRRALYLDRHFVLAHYYLGTAAAKAGDSWSRRPVPSAMCSSCCRKPNRTESFPKATASRPQELEKLTTMHLKVLENV